MKMNINFICFQNKISNKKASDCKNKFKLLSK